MILIVNITNKNGVFVYDQCGNVWIPQKDITFLTKLQINFVVTNIGEILLHLP
jgi:hypothetical protein